MGIALGLSRKNWIIAVDHIHKVATVVAAKVVVVVGDH